MSHPTHLHPTPLRTLAPHLLPYLPSSLPLLRRLQFHHSPPSAHTFATFPPSSQPPTPAFAAAWVDRSRAPETECWLFSTYDTLPPSQQEQQKPVAKEQLFAILADIAALPGDSELMVIGTLSETLLGLIGGEGVRGLVPSRVLTRDVGIARGVGSEGLVLGISGLYLKWLIAPPSPMREEESGEGGLPEGYHFDKARGERGEFGLVISRTEIPRTEESLGRLGCVGIRYICPDSAGEKRRSGSEEGGGGELVAWAFLGVDGSLTSLYVEPQHRGKGLAKKMSGKLLRRLVERPGDMGFRSLLVGEGEGWVGSDVAVENLESAGVARGLGGIPGWEVRWVSVDLGRVREAVGRMGKRNEGEEIS